MKVGREYSGGRVNTPVILAFAFAEKLLPPLRHHSKARIVGHQHFNRLVLFVQNISYSRIFIAVVLFNIGIAKLLLRRLCAVHKSVDIASGAGDGKKSYRREHAVSAPYVIGNNERFIAVSVGKLLKSASRLIGGGVYSALGSIGAVFLLQHFAEHSECQCGFCGCARLGNYVYGKISSLNKGNNLAEISGADGISHKVYFGGILFKRIVKS